MARKIDGPVVDLIEKAFNLDIIQFFGKDPRPFLEKDILVATAVAEICRIGQADGAQIIFAGGTSLSQAWGVIKRLSEDADFRIALPPDVTSGNQRKKYLSAIKADIVKVMGDLGFPLVDTMKGRNSNAYMMGEFIYDSRYPQSRALRPFIKLEITAFEPVDRVDTLPLQPVIERIIQAPVLDSTPRVPVVSLTDTLADKVVSYLRRTAAERAGFGRGAYDQRLVRHIYDVAHIIPHVRKAGEEAMARDLFARTVERDRLTYGNQFEPFRDDPYGVLADALNRIHEPVGDLDVAKMYESFVNDMVYERKTGFDEAAGVFMALADEWLSCGPQNQDQGTPKGRPRGRPRP